MLLLLEKQQQGREKVVALKRKEKQQHEKVRRKNGANSVTYFTLIFINGLVVESLGKKFRLS